MLTVFSHLPNALSCVSVPVCSRENRQLTNKERKEKNRLEKQVGKELDLCIAKATTAVTEAAADPLPDLGTLLI